MEDSFHLYCKKKKKMLPFKSWFMLSQIPKELKTDTFQFITPCSPIKPANSVGKGKIPVKKQTNKNYQHGRLAWKKDCIRCLKSQHR